MNWIVSKSALPRLWLLACALIGTRAAAEPFDVRDGDRIVMVGSTFIERDVRYGCIETLLTAQFRDRAVTFRNLGWSGDDVFGTARASFDPVSVGYERLVNQIKEAAPTVLLMNYGQNESYRGAEGLDAFIGGYSKLLDDVAPLNARIVLISPTLQLDMGAPLPDPSAHNDDVRTYSRAIAQLAETRGLRFVDLTQLLRFPPEGPASRWTDNGVHFTEDGYWNAAAAIAQGLGHPVGDLTVANLRKLRGVINEKNRLFFLKWRPQNETYITGFRKYEQGRHVAETPMFDPLVAEQEKKIAELRRALPTDGVGK